VHIRLSFLDKFFESKSGREVVIVFILTVMLLGFISSIYLSPRLNNKIALLRESSGINSIVKQDNIEQLLQAKNIESEKLKIKLDSLKNEYTVKRKAIENNRMMFLDEKTVNLFLNFLAINFSKNGLKIDSLKSTVLPSRTSNRLGRAIVEIEFTGDFKSLLYMLNSIETSSFPCVVDALRIKKTEEQRAIKISLYGFIK